MKRILITGAKSYIGDSFAKYAQEHGYDYSITTVDTMDDSWRKFDFSVFDIVFHVAGIAHADAKKRMKTLYYKVNRDLAIEVGLTAKMSGIKQFIFMSSIIVYGESHSLKPFMITENTIPKPNGFYGDSKLQAEQGLMRLEDKRFKVAILRPPMIYGPGSKGNFPKLIKLAGVLPVFPDFHNRRSMLYIDNLCEFIRKIIDTESRGVYFPQNAEYMNTSVLIQQLAELQGSKVVLTKILVPLVYLISPFVKSVNKLFGSLFYKQQVYECLGTYNSIAVAESLKATVGKS